jgi:hypothetical protein
MSASPTSPLEDLVRELVLARKAIAEKAVAVEEAKLLLSDRRRDYAAAVRAKEEIEEELTDPGRRPLLAAIAAKAGSMVHEPDPNEAERERQASRHWHVHEYSDLGLRHVGKRLGSVIARSFNAAVLSAQEGWAGRRILVGDSFPHGPGCGCPEPDDNGDIVIDPMKAAQAERELDDAVLNTPKWAVSVKLPGISAREVLGTVAAETGRQALAAAAEKYPKYAQPDLAVARVKTGKPRKRPAR